MPLIETKGAASAQGFGGAGAGASGPVTYIEDVFSTYLYTGNGSTQTITNGIDLSGKGGLVWIKGRSGATDHALYDTARGATKDLVSNSTAAETTQSTGLTAFSGTGFSIGALAKLNTNAATYASWTIREQPKFFDIVTYTGNGSVPRSIAHNLGSVPGFIAIKLTSGADNWICRHRSTGDTPNDMTNYVANDRLFLNTTGAAGSSSNIKADATTFTVNHTGDLNANGATYVAYLFAHNAGGFGLTGTDNVISCGSYTGNGSATGPVVTLGYEPQWLLIKNVTDGATNWTLVDNMRGFPVGNAAARLLPNLSDAEYTNITVASPLPTGFQITNTNSFCNTSGSTYIYIAIRRGPMKVPTSGTSVYNAVTYTGNNTNPRLLDFSLNLDAALFHKRNSNIDTANIFGSRLVGDPVLYTNATDSEVPLLLANNAWASNVGVSVRDDGKINGTSYTYVSWGLKRAPGFFDVVCYTGTAGNLGINHNLGAVPQLIIFKQRGNTTAWWVWHTSFTTYPTYHLILNTTAAQATGQYLTDVTSTSFSLANAITTAVNANGGTYVTYLFGTCAGVSKVGSYTGTGTTLQIDCGFTGGARFVLIKRVDSTGDWYVYDSARGISSGNDPYLLLNSTAAEVTGTNYVDTTSVGFQVTAAAPADLNASGGTFIFLAIS